MSAIYLLLYLYVYFWCYVDKVYAMKSMFYVSLDFIFLVISVLYCVDTVFFVLFNDNIETVLYHIFVFCF